MTRRLVRLLSTSASRLSAGIALALAILWLSSHRWYTTAGFDFERPWGDRWLTRYVRARWDAGCFWIGLADQPIRARARGMDWWDPGGTLFARSIPPRPRSLPNRWGWWLIRDVPGDPYEPIRYPGAIASRWVGVPGWLPPAACCGWPLARWLTGRRGRNASGGS